MAPFEPIGRFPDASNATLLVRFVDRDTVPLDELAARLGRDPGIDDLDPEGLAVYKPERGEAPLWDFPPGTLHRREVAAFEVARALGWDLVPWTVLREDGPFGPGSLQRFVAHDPELHYFRLLEDGTTGVLDQLRRMVVFDLLIDNADRKAGHVLLADARWDTDPEPRVTGRVQLVDHGVSLHVERKLRTVAWEFEGEPLPAEAADALDRLEAGLEGSVGVALLELLSPDERAVLTDRIERVRRLSALPGPSGPRPYPWPPI